MKVPGEKKVLCGLCNNEYSYLGTTSNLREHLRRHHKDKYGSGRTKARNKLAWILSLLGVSVCHCVPRKLQN